MVENIVAHNRLNIGIHKPNFVSSLSEYVLQNELPKGWKVPKFTKFAGDTSELTLEHIAWYLTEAGDMANNENLKMKYFLNYLTKHTFRWFTRLFAKINNTLYGFSYSNNCKDSTRAY